MALAISLQPDSNLAAAAQYDVYSAYLNEGLANNPHDFGNGAVTILIATESMMAHGVSGTQKRRFAAGSAMYLRRLPDPPRLSLILGLFLANWHTHKLERRFKIPTEFHLLDSAALDDPNRQERFPRSAGFHTFSSVAFNSHLTEALFYTEHICGLCGGGEYVVMENVLGKWVIVNRYSTWVS